MVARMRHRRLHPTALALIMSQIERAKVQQNYHVFYGKKQQRLFVHYRRVRLPSAFAPLAWHRCALQLETNYEQARHFCCALCHAKASAQFEQAKRLLDRTHARMLARLGQKTHPPCLKPRHFAYPCAALLGSQMAKRLLHRTC